MSTAKILQKARIVSAMKRGMERLDIETSPRELKRPNAKVVRAVGTDYNGRTHYEFGRI